MGKTLFLACVVLVALFIIFQNQDPGARRPDPGDYAPPPEDFAFEPSGDTSAGEILPPPTERMPYYNFESSEPCQEVCLGSAFAIEPAGTWLTAQHVVEGCRQVYLKVGKALRVGRIYRHPRADVSVILTKPVAPTLGFDFSDFRQRQDGFHFGYPGGKPGSVYSQLLGRAAARHGGPGGWKEPVIAWAEVQRAPNRRGSLGGISGGAVLNHKGSIVGVTIAEEPRRGRVISAAPVSLLEVLQRAGVKPSSKSSSGSARITPTNFDRAGRELRDRHTVAQVVCSARA